MCDAALAIERTDGWLSSHVKRGVLSMGHSVPLRKRPADTRLWSDGHRASV